MHDLKADFCLSSTESLTSSMVNEGNSMLPDMNDMDTMIQSPLIVSDSYANYAPLKSQSVIESEWKQELGAYNSISIVGGNGFNMRGTVDDLPIPVQYDFLPTDDSLFPVGIGDQLLPKSKLPSLSLHEDMGIVFTPQVTEGAVRCENIGLPKESDCLLCTSHGTSDKFHHCGCAYAWPPRIVDEKCRKDANTMEEYAICCGLGRSWEMYALEQFKEADDILACRKVIANQSSQEYGHYSGKVIANQSSQESGHYSGNIEPIKCRLYFADSVVDSHTLVENIQNSSLQLIASHSSESDRLLEDDVQALLSVIDYLSKYLMDRAGISASCIQAAIQPVEDHSISNSRVCEKGTDCKNMGEFSGHEKDKCLENRLSELQKQVKKLKEDFRFELKERDTAIHFYKNLLREYKAALSTTMSEMEHITDPQLLKQNKFRTDAHLFDVRGGKTSENRDGKMLKTSLEINLKPRDNVTDQAERSEERDPEDCDVNTNLTSAMDTISPVNAEGPFWEPLAVLHSHLESLGKAFEIRRITGSDCSVVLDLNQKDAADKAVKLLSCTRDCGNAEIKKNQISLMNDTPQAHYENSLWQQAAISMFPEKCPQESDTRRNLNFCNHDAVGVSSEIETNEEILRRFKHLQECYHLYMIEKNTEKQLGKAIKKNQISCTRDCENAEIKKNQISLMNDTPQAHYENNLWQQAAISMFLERCPQESDTRRNLNFCNHDAVRVSPEIGTNEEILRRFKHLQECYHLHMREKTTEKQLGKAIIDESSSCKNSLFHENAVDNSYPKSSESNQEDNQSRQDEGTYLNQETKFPFSDKSLRKGETSEIRDQTNSMFSPEVDRKLKGNVDQTAILVSCGKLCESHETKTDSNYPMNVRPQTDYKHSIWDRAAILFSRDERLGDLCISRNMNVVDNDILDAIPKSKIHPVDNETIHSGFRSLQESNKSGLIARASAVQSDEATVNMSGSCNNVFHLEENEADSSYSESEAGSLSSENEAGSSYSESEADSSSSENEAGSSYSENEADSSYSESYESLQDGDNFWEWATISPREEKLRESELSDIGDRTNSNFWEWATISPQEEKLREGELSDIGDRTNSNFWEWATISPQPQEEKLREGELSDIGDRTNSNFWKWATISPQPQEEKRREGEFSDTGDRTNSTCFIKVDSNLEQVRDRASILLSRKKVCENPKTNTYLNCLVNITPKAHYEGSVWDRAAILFSREESCGESERCRNMTTCDHDAMEREEILHRFRVLQECSDQSDTTQRDYGEQLSEAIIDEPGLCNYFLHLKENACDKSNSESLKSIQEHNQAFHDKELANQSVYPDSNEVEASYGALYYSEASGDRIEDGQPIVASRSFVKQTSCPHESEPEDNCDMPMSPYLTIQSPHSHLKLKIPVAFRTEQSVLPSIESSFDEKKLIRNTSVHYQSEPSSLIQKSDVAVGSRSKYLYNRMNPVSSKSDSNQVELINANTMEYFARERKYDNVFTRDHSSQMLSPTSFSILKLDSDRTNTFTGKKNQNCSNPSKGSTDAESLDHEELHCSPQSQHDISQHNFYSKLESSSTESESSWECVEKEEDSASQ